MLVVVVNGSSSISNSSSSRSSGRVNLWAMCNIMAPINNANI